MKALHRQTVTLALVALVSPHAYVIVSHAANAGRAGDHSSNLHAPESVGQLVSSEQAKPVPAPARWRGLIGEYGPDDGILYILEKDRRLCACSSEPNPNRWKKSRKTFSSFPRRGRTRASDSSSRATDTGGRRRSKSERSCSNAGQIEPEEARRNCSSSPCAPSPNC